MALRLLRTQYSTRKFLLMLGHSVRGGHSWEVGSYQTGLQNSIVGVVTRSGSIGSSRGHHGKPLRGPQWQIMTDRVSDTLCNH